MSEQEGAQEREPDAGSANAAAQVPPAFSVVSGSPTAEELAALTAVVVALQGAQQTPASDGPGRSWVRRALLSLGPRPGPASWRRSGR
ncbi:acyl-CoA carboxylase subunit epsilon [Arthrobacter echini]|uniref:Acyl-CoA carboxylase subunit epsilon n=1 Tax=Arthrobacter echini TaxID=1529066 RepID=A0A4S5E843_9MICC|nr:acyl-CoA carboxylase subunit epsilon [Arthrobacter echini]THJ67817.1 acyl-CoA carboxylase subunit epsilon [Arthrobacter echini]